MNQSKINKLIIIKSFFLINNYPLFYRPALEPEIIYLRHVERAKPFSAPSEEDRVYPPPQFIVPLRDLTQVEGGKVHFETRIEPVGDPSMTVEWFLNGNMIVASKKSLDLCFLNPNVSNFYTLF